MQAALCMLFTALCVNGVSSSPLKSLQAGEKLASTDEVNILMYGVLQFSESLHHMYQSTEARLGRVMKAISRTESEVKRLGHDTEETAKNERQIKEKLQLLQVKPICYLTNDIYIYIYTHIYIYIYLSMRNKIVMQNPYPRTLF